MAEPASREVRGVFRGRGGREPAWAKRGQGGHPSRLSQSLSEVCPFARDRRGYYDTHLSATQQELDRRYEACLSCLDEVMPSDVRWTTPGGGPTLWLEVPRRIPLAALSARVRSRGVDIEDTRDTFVEPTPHLHGFRVSYAYSPLETVRRGLTIVADEIRAFG